MSVNKVILIGNVAETLVITYFDTGGLSLLSLWLLQTVAIHWQNGTQVRNVRNGIILSFNRLAESLKICA